MEPDLPAAPAKVVAENATIRIAMIRESATNPRQAFDQTKLKELAESIHRFGLKQPVLVRPLTDADLSTAEKKAGVAFELVFGARRRRAALLAGLETIRADVQELSDLEVLELQVVENTQREDVHPLEEGTAFRRLRDAHGRTVEQIAAKIGKSKAYVYGRMKLAELAEPVQKLMVEGKLGAEVALLVARIGSPKLQVEAAKEIAGGPSQEPMTYLEAKDMIGREYMLSLTAAPFDTADPSLIPQALPCTTCPKRSGNQLELLGEVKSKDVCTDPECFGKKRDAGWKKTAAAAKAAGRTVLSQEEAKKLYPQSWSGLARGSEYLEAKSVCYEDPKKRTLGELLKADETLQPALVRNPHTLEVVELIPAAGLKRRLKAAGHKFAQPASAKAKEERAELSAAARAEAEKGELTWRSAAHAKREVMRRTMEVAGKDAEVRGALHLLAHALGSEPSSYGFASHCRARHQNLDVEHNDELTDEQLLTLAGNVATWSLPELELLALELLFDGAISGGPYHGQEAIKRIAKTAGVDMKACAAEGKMAAKLEIKAAAAKDEKKGKGGKGGRVR